LLILQVTQFLEGVPCTPIAGWVDRLLMKLPSVLWCWKHSILCWYHILPRCHWPILILILTE